MRIGTDFVDHSVRTAARSTNVRGSRFSAVASETTKAADESRMAAVGNLLWQRTEKEEDDQPQGMRTLLTDGEEAVGESASGRSEAAKIYDAAFKGGENPIENLRKAPKVPYGHLAQDGVIIYNGVLFTCDEKTNSICLGDVSDPKQVINVTLSGGGHLKVNRDNIGQLGKALGMFSPEDVNLILRAIHQDTKLQSMQKELEDMEASVGEQIASGDDAAETDGELSEDADREILGETGRKEEEE
ncbi:MAG: hypothetical protein NC331_01530 [Lachnospiraceae bacterium]|nr:hypothetical protein [Lachnospiraceae bacterium]MCM1238048.1 hypothetical protein [Lachnospiraceae bacterium]